MQKILLIISAIFVVQYASAQQSASALLNMVLSNIEHMNPYKVNIEVQYGSSIISGFYEVDNESYYISVDQQELYGDQVVKYEVYNSRKEVVIDEVIADFNGNILNNPASAFMNLQNNYTPTIVATNQDFTIVELKQNGDDSISSEIIELIVNNQSGLPSSIIYKLDDEVVRINITKMEKLSSSITLFDESQYSDYEIIDFR